MYVIFLQPTQVEFIHLINTWGCAPYRPITRELITCKIYEDHSLIGQPTFKLKNIMLASSTFHTSHPYINFTLKIRKFGAPARSLDLFEKGPPSRTRRTQRKGFALGSRHSALHLYKMSNTAPPPGRRRHLGKRKHTSL